MNNTVFTLKFFKSMITMILNKIDLLPYLNFNVDDCIEYVRTVNPDIKVFQLSAMTSKGMETWYVWLKEQIASNVSNKATV
jgi:hydrogenase nickel incorporation protein HypB